MSDAIITVENLSKRYLVGHQSEYRQQFVTFREMIVRETRNFARKTTDFVQGRPIIQGDEVEEFWALRKVSFEIKQGDIVGIIGRNGAGKSTMLKILSRITEPTEGRVVLRGRVASMLEVGTGFHPELTGRENIFLYGAILGMTQWEIRKKFDEIVAFAEAEMFLDTPVKRYSSGMYVRLAFAVAAHLDPDILILDEVLAIGDADFQRKCLGKMDDVSHREGRTVLFVSHNMQAIKTLCPSTIWLDRGRVCRQGNSQEVIGEYLATISAAQGRFVKLDDIQRLHTSEGGLRLLSLEWQCDLPLRHDEPIKGRIRFHAHAGIRHFAVGIGFSNLEGGRILTYETGFQSDFRPDVPRDGEYCVEFTVESLPLAPDVYALDVFCRSSDVNSLDYVPAAIQVEIVAGPKSSASFVQNNIGVHLASTWAWSGSE